jgi:hypothetical protein
MSATMIAYDPESPHFDVSDGVPAWARCYEPEWDPAAIAANAGVDLADYAYDPESPPAPPPTPRDAPTTPPSYDPTSPIFPPGCARDPDPVTAPTAAKRAPCTPRKRFRPTFIADVLDERSLDTVPNADLTSDAERMFAFDMCASKAGLLFFINSASPQQALSVEHGPMTAVPEAMLESATRLQSTLFVLSSRSEKCRRVYEIV